MSTIFNTLFCSHNWETLLKNDETHPDEVVIKCSKCGKIKTIKHQHTHKWELIDRKDMVKTKYNGYGAFDTQYTVYYWKCEICSKTKCDEV